MSRDLNLLKAHLHEKFGTEFEEKNGNLRLRNPNRDSTGWEDLRIYKDYALVLLQRPSSYGLPLSKPKSAVEELVAETIAYLNRNDYPIWIVGNDTWEENIWKLYPDGLRDEQFTEASDLRKTNPELRRNIDEFRRLIWAYEYGALIAGMGGQFDHGVSRYFCYLKNYDNSVTYDIKERKYSFEIEEEGDQQPKVKKTVSGIFPDDKYPED